VIRVLIADDHAVVRRGLRELVKEEISNVTFAEAGTAPEALALVKKRDWEIMILDISMPGKSGMDILADVKALRPRLPVLILSVHPEEQFAKRALQTGAAGYLTKESIPEELVAAVRKVLAGGRYLSAGLMEKLAWDLGKDSRGSDHETLSNREFQVLRMLASGSTVKQAADQLGLSVKTVSTYRARILLKMGMKNTAELIRYAIRHRLVE
jgi:two-component system, NarL family, invasion response regulator UvrY